MDTTTPWVHGPLQASSGGRFLEHSDDTPFFFLGDTAWEMANRALPEEIEPYIICRSRQGFNVQLFRCGQRFDQRWRHTFFPAVLGAGQRLDAGDRQRRRHS